jgi:hypothetical protein
LLAVGTEVPGNPASTLDVIPTQPLSIDVLAETGGELVLARLDYGHCVAYELVTHPHFCSPEALDEAAALLPAGMVPLSVLPSACLGNVGETVVTFWLVVIPTAR